MLGQGSVVAIDATFGTNMYGVSYSSVALLIYKLHYLVCRCIAHVIVLYFVHSTPFILSSSMISSRMEFQSLIF